jgi:hypothetical protein
MTPRYAGPLALLALLLSACGQGSGSHPRADAGQPAADPAGSITLTVHSSVRPGKHGEMFVEGAVPELRLTAPDGTELTPAQDHRDDAVFAGLDPGRYRLHAALRPCDGNCGYLDGPTAPCAATVHVMADREVSVRWRVGQPCRVSA